MENIVKKKEIINLWEEEWRGQSRVSNPEELFLHPLFSESYPVLKKYVGPDAWNILEIGAGSGRYGIKIAQDFPESKVLLTDVAQESLALIGKLISYFGVKNAEVKKEDVLNLSFGDNHFDLVFCDALIQHLPFYDLAISEMIRVLRPGGRLIITAVNSWNFPHTLYKYYLRIFSKKYQYGYEKSFNPKELQDVLFEKKLKIVVQDGVYFAFGIYRLKNLSGFFKFLGRVFNRLSKIIDPLVGRAISRYFGFKIIVVAQKLEKSGIDIKVKNSGVIKLQFFNDYPDGNLVIGEAMKNVPFEIKRLYYINNLSNFSAKRGHHAHKKLEQYIFCVNGRFAIELDDGRGRQKILMDNPYHGIRLGPKLWHEMSEFSDDCVIMVLANDYYEEADYIRNYDEFLKYIKENHTQ